ncbi:MAG TPA: hypothetical protein V6C69_01810, partial [Trichormus sp.]|jgi:hypothetical protein
MVILLAGIMLFTGYQKFMVERERVRYATQAAAMTAARELSNIAMPDQYWGYISLSDHPANGKATIAGDGEPLPVTSINTVTAGVRTEKLIAGKAGSAVLNQVAGNDYDIYQQSTANFQKALNQAVLPTDSSQSIDMNGKSINVYAAAYKSFKDNLPELRSGTLRVRDFSIELGWLADGSTTVTPDASRSADQNCDEATCYKSFIDQPVDGDSFYFAGVSREVRLVEPSRFCHTDGKRLCSCLRVRARIEMLPTSDAPERRLPAGTYRTCKDLASPDAAKMAALQMTAKASDVPAFGANTSSGTKGDTNVGDNGCTVSISSAACALPYCQPNYCAPGTLAVSLPQGSIAKVSTLCDLISLDAANQIRSSCTRAKGDFPLDSGSTLVQDPQCTTSIGYELARSFFHWLRTCNGRERVDSVVSALTTNFTDESVNQMTDLVVTYSMDYSGNLHVNTLMDAGFQTKVIADQQTRSTAVNLLSTDKGELCVEVRDEVATPGIGINSGGKHGGQPLPSLLPMQYSQFLPDLKQRQLISQNEGDCPIRQSFVKGGLAVAIELYCVPPTN